MERLIKNGDVILDGTVSRAKKEKAAFEKLELIENIMEEFEIKSVENLKEILDDYDKMALAVVQMGLELTKDKRL